MRKTIVELLCCFGFSSLILSANSIVTVDFAESHPFYEWPGNETLSPENTTVYLRCIVQNCLNGPRIVVGVRQPNCLFEATRCLKTTDQTDQKGLMIVETAITLSWIENYASICELESLPIPVWCEIGGRRHKTGYIHVNYDDQKPVTATSENASPQTVVSPCACSVNDSSKLTYMDVRLVVMACIITILVNR